MVQVMFMIIERLIMLSTVPVVVVIVVVFMAMVMGTVSALAMAMAIATSLAIAMEMAVAMEMAMPRAVAMVVVVAVATGMEVASVLSTGVACQCFLLVRYGLIFVISVVMLSPTTTITTDILEPRQCISNSHSTHLRTCLPWDVVDDCGFEHVVLLLLFFGLILCIAMWLAHFGRFSRSQPVAMAYRLQLFGAQALGTRRPQMACAPQSGRQSWRDTLRRSAPDAARRCPAARSRPRFCSDCRRPPRTQSGTGSTTPTTAPERRTPAATVATWRACVSAWGGHALPLYSCHGQRRARDPADSAAVSIAA